MDQKSVFAQFEKVIATVLVLLMSVVVVSATIELGHNLYIKLVEPPGMLLGMSELFELFGMFMMVLIAIELMSSIYLYLQDKVAYLEIMFLIAITAVTRKIVILDAKSIDPLTTMGIAALLAALIAGYYVVKCKCREK